MTDDEERAYVLGKKAVYRRLLAECLVELGPDAPDAARLIAERAEAVAMLRRVCEDHGDNDWSDTLHLADVIEKHLYRHLESP